MDAGQPDVRGDVHTFSIKKVSLVVDNTELTEEEIAFAFRVRTLLDVRLSDEFWSYVRALTLTFHIKPDEVKLALGFELFIPTMEKGIPLEFNTLLINVSNMAEVVAVTSPTHIEALLRIYARETGEYQTELQEAARIVRR